MKKILLGLLFSFQIHAQQLLINEFMAINNSTIKDNFDRYEDWIEIYNPTNFTIDLYNYGLTDDKTNPYKWKFKTSLELPPKSYLLIWASNRDTIIGDIIHTNFALNGSGEFIGLSSPLQTFIDSISFGQQTADRSLGRTPDGGSQWTVFVSPTPGFSNDSLSTLQLPTPNFSHPSGIYSTPFQLSMTHPVEGVQIYYTLDGNHPSVSSNLYTGPINIDSNLVIRAIAYKEGRPQSKIATRSFFIQPGGNLPILSIVTDQRNLFDPDSGIYVNPDSIGVRWERFSTLEFIERNNTKKFSIDAGIRIHGGATRDREKKSFRFHFKKEYGNNLLIFDFFNSKADKFDELVVKSGSNDCSRLAPRWTLIRDQFISNLFSQNKGLISNGIYARVYLNGQPFGIYNIREHIDSMYLKQHLGINYPELRETWVQKLGSPASWDTLWTFLWNNEILDSVKYKFVEDRIDIDNYIDYISFEIFAGNFDWPHNNLFFARNAQGGKWKYIMWDVDQTFRIYTNHGYNSIEWILRDTVRTDLYDLDEPSYVTSTILPRRLFSNEKFKEKFINRFTDLLNTVFQTSNTIPLIDSLKNHLVNDIPFEISRWGSSFNRWIANIDTLKMYVQTRVDSLRLFTIQKFGFGGLNDVVVNLTTSPNGKVFINDLKIDKSVFTGKYFNGMKINIKAVPDLGYKFIGWSDSTLPHLQQFTTIVDRDFYLEPIFTLDTSTIAIQANDVIINEYWLDDNGTRYASIDFRPIYGTWVELLVTKDEGIDLRNWRLTNNSTKLKRDTLDLTEGSVLFKNIPQFSLIPKGTYILLILNRHPSNDYYFSVDDLDPSDSTMIIYIGNGNLDKNFDPGFRIRDVNDRLVLLHPGKNYDYSDDIGIDFISEGSEVTPQSFGISNDGVNFINPFVGIGDDDGAIFAFSSLNNFNNDNGIDETPGDDRPGSGGWIVDPAREFTGDDPTNPNQINILTPGKKNYSGTLDVADLIIPKEFRLYNNYPNPFNSQTKIKFDIPRIEKVEIKVFDILGREITKLVDDVMTPGSYTLIFDSNRFGLASGIYIFRIQAGDFIKSQKMILLK